MNIHIEQLNKKIGKMIGFLRRLRYFINESNLKLIYTSVIMPHFDYADTVWQTANNIILINFRNFRIEQEELFFRLNLVNIYLFSRFTIPWIGKP